MRVAVFRAADDGARTAKRLAALGHETILAPVIQIVQTGQRLPPGSPAAVIFTSAHGVEAIAADRALAGLRSLPTYCVGTRTEDCATALGFTDVRGARANAEKLAALLKSEIEHDAALLIVAGRDRKPVLERNLSALGYRITVSEVYEARPAPPWPDSVSQSFVSGAVETALHYSRRSAELAVAQSGAMPGSSGFLQLRHCCLSDDAAIPLRGAGARTIVVASHPDETSLLACL